MTPPLRIEGSFRSGPMTFQEYDERYPPAVAALQDAIRSALPAARVEHVGSTAVPGLGGRGTLDVVVVAEPEEHPAVIAALRSLGFIESPLGHFKPMLTGVLHLGDGVFPVLLYVLPDDSPLLRGWLAWRTYLRQHPEEARVRRGQATGDRGRQDTSLGLSASQDAVPRGSRATHRGARTQHGVTSPCMRAPHSTCWSRHGSCSNPQNH